MQARIPKPRVIRPDSTLGEAPVWHPESARLFWVDCAQKLMHRFDPETGDVRTYALPGSPASYAFCHDGRLLLAYRNKIVLMELESGVQRVIETPMVDFSNVRFNDGACDRAGRFWLGTMHKGMSEPVGALYRIDPDLSIHEMAEGIAVSNGIAFSPDDMVMYHTDSRSAIVYAYDFDLVKGAISNRRVFADFGGEHERPDGCTVDKDGSLWVAMLGGGRVVVLDRNGQQVDTIPLPTTRPTSLCFGGKALDTLYVTSMRFSLSEEDLMAQPDAGSVFAFSGAGHGLPEPYFGG